MWSSNLIQSALEVRCMDEKACAADSEKPAYEVSESREKLVI